MEDPEILKQKLEFMQIELDEAKSREASLKNMYESMLKSLTNNTDYSVPSQTPQQLKDAQDQHTAELNSLKSKHKEVIDSYESHLSVLKNTNSDLEYQLREQKMKSEDAVLKLKQENYLLTEQKRELENKIEELNSKNDKKKAERLESEVDKLNKELEKSKLDAEEDLKSAREQTQQCLQELKEIYQQDKQALEKQVEKLQWELKLQKEQLENEYQEKINSSLSEKLESAIDESSKQMQELVHARREAEEAAEKWRTELQILVSDIGSKLNTRKKSNIKDRIESTQHMLTFAENTQEELKKLRTQMKSFQKLISSLESTSARQKEVIKQKDEEIDHLKRNIRLRASEERKHLDVSNSNKQKETLSEQLLEKETEISRLKRQLGDLRVEMSLSITKPPVPSPRKIHHRSNSSTPKFENLSSNFILPTKEEEDYKRVTLEQYNYLKSCQKLVESASSFECENCKALLEASQFHGHSGNCKVNTEETTSYNSPVVSTKASPSHSECKENDRKLPNCDELKIRLRKAKNQREKAKIENEKLLMQLKQVKLDWAISEENSAEKILQLKKEMKRLMQIAVKTRQSFPLPPNFSYEIESAIKNSARFFGGKCTFKPRSSQMSPQRRSKQV